MSMALFLFNEQEKIIFNDFYICLKKKNYLDISEIPIWIWSVEENLSARAD